MTVPKTHHILNCFPFGAGDYFSSLNTEKEKSPIQLRKTDFSKESFYWLVSGFGADSARQTAGTPHMTSESLSLPFTLYPYAFHKEIEDQNINTATDFATQQSVFNREKKPKTKKPLARKRTLTHNFIY